MWLILLSWIDVYTVNSYWILSLDDCFEGMLMNWKDSNALI